MKNRKGLIAVLLIVVAVVAVVLLTSSNEDDEGYVVRAIFDNGSFMVPGEQVRIAGANVGEVQEVNVTVPGEVDAYAHDQPQKIPGKAVIVMAIEDAGFQDFRSDASCLIRPQSLIGEKYVDCRPTLPRAPGSKPPPPLRKIPSGQPGAGQRLLPLENTSSSVDPDLINDIQTLPYAQRFRLIFNELGAALTGRGADIEAAVKRANPALRDADRVLEILDSQRDELTELASNAEQVVNPLARERTHVAGFLANAGASGEATAERGADLEASLRKFPEFLVQFRQTMQNLKGFSDAATPVVSDLDRATPALTEATRHLAPFTAASTVALKALGNAAEGSGPKFAAADPIVKKARELAKTGVSPTTELGAFLENTKQTKGFNDLADLIYNSTGALNEFDRYGHLIRSLVTLSNCLEYVSEPGSGCGANFGTREASSSSTAELFERIQEELAERTGGVGATTTGPSTFLNPATPTEAAPELGQGEGLEAESVEGGEAEAEGEAESEGEAEAEGASVRATAPQRALLNYLLGP